MPPDIPELERALSDTMPLDPAELRPAIAALKDTARGYRIGGHEDDARAISRTVRWLEAWVAMLEVAEPQAPARGND